MNSRILVTTTLLLILPFIGAEPQATCNWPCFHGPERTNKSTETGLLKKWPQNGPKLLFTISGLAEGPITVNMRDYGNMEKVGSLGRSLPRNDESITTKAGDIILYQGNALVIYYAPNSWSFTRLGSIDDITPEELIEVLGKGSVTVTLSLPQD